MGELKMMLRVMLVDDEPFIRQGMKILIDWKKYGYEVVAEAENGIEALKIMQKEQIDLVFADLRMPGMSGIEFVEKALSLGFEMTYFVILTGYADFDSAKKAIRLHVQDYILKPIQKIEVERLLESLSESLQNLSKNKEKEENRSIAEKILEYTEKHYGENVSLIEMGKIFQMNHVYLGQLFKKKYGVSYKEYLTNLRIKKAVQLLENTSIKVYDVAEKVGYKNAEYFISKFTEIKGITPHQYRLKMQGVDNGEKKFI